MLSLSELQSISDLIADDVYGVLTLEGSVNSRDHVGGTAPSQVRQAINRAQTEIASR
jgi:argininosuccinate lyase